MSRIIRAITTDGSARAFAIDGKDIVNRAIAIHHTSPTASAALGRTLLAASLMGSLMGEKQDSLTIRFKGDGGGGTILASSDYSGNVRGFISNPSFDCPTRVSDGKLDVAKCVGKGFLNVLRDTGGAEPYSGISPIVSGEIAEDIAYYYATSEQIPTICALGVLVDTDYTCKAAGGVLIQLLPFSDPAIADRLEDNLKTLRPLTTVLAESSLEEALAGYLQGINYEFFDEFDCVYKCTCSRDRTDKALISLGKSELESMLNDPQDHFDINCQFCDKTYLYTKKDIQKLMDDAI